MSIQNRFGLPLKFAIFISLFFGLLTSAEPLTGAEKAGIIYLRNIDISTMDPGLSNDHYSAEVHDNIFEGLVRFKKQSKDVEPCLATSWEIKDNGLRWVFVLRKGVKFHNGEAVNADAVKNAFKIKLVARKEKYKGFRDRYAFIDKILVLNEYKLAFYLKFPYFPFLQSLAYPGASIAAPSSYKSDSFIPIGTGPFMFDKWQKGKFVIIKKNPNYWEKKIGIDRVIFKVVEDTFWRTSQIKTGKADISVITSDKEYNTIIGNNDLKFFQFNSNEVSYLAFNTKKSPLNNLKIRRAIAHMINKKLLVRHIFNNFAVNATTPVPPQIEGHNPEIKDYEYNLSLSKTLIKDSGVKTIPALNLYYAKGSIEREQIANVLVRNGQKIGINIKRIVLPFAEMREKINKGAHHMVMMGWVGDLPDPDSYLFSTFTTGAGKLNRSFYNDPKLTGILIEARQSSDRELRKKLYRNAQEMIHDAIPWIPLYHPRSFFAYNRRIKGLYLNNLSHLIFRDCRVEE